MLYFKYQTILRESLRVLVIRCKRKVNVGDMILPNSLNLIDLYHHKVNVTP